MNDGERPAVRVLICDDHKVVAQGLASVLTSEPDIDVVGIAGSVRDVIEQAAGLRPDVVLLDYELPDGDGVAATEALKKARPEIKVVLLTAFSSEAVLVAAVEAGCSGFLTKHDGSQVVADGVRLAASGEALVSAAMLRQVLPRLSRTSRKSASDLTARETEVLELLAEGVATQAIAERLYLSNNTVRNHAQSILMKLGVHSRLEAVSTAVREGIIRRR